MYTGIESTRRDHACCARKWTSFDSIPEVINIKYREVACPETADSSSLVRKPLHTEMRDRVSISRRFRPLAKRIELPESMIILSGQFLRERFESKLSITLHVSCKIWITMIERRSRISRRILEAEKRAYLVYMYIYIKAKIGIGEGI